MTNKILAALYAISLSGCTSVVHQDDPEAALLAQINQDPQALSDARIAGEHCLVPVPTSFERYSCPARPIAYDRQACVKFDEAVQRALVPIRTCAALEADSVSAAVSEACLRQINAFLRPCVGVHAVHLAHSEREKSQAYREAIESGMSESEARARYLAQLVRYRD